MTSESTEDDAKELRILGAVRQVLTRIARETAPPPGQRHVLSSGAIEDIRAALMLISARERELNEDQGIQSTLKPKFGEPAAGESGAVVSLESLLRTSPILKKK